MNSTLTLPVPRSVPSGMLCLKIWLIAMMMRSWRSCTMKMMHFRIFYKPVVTENEQLHLPVHQNILAASPYLIVHTVGSIHHPARPLSPPSPNIQHQVQCDPCANISVKNDINFLRDTVTLENPFLVSSADQNAPAMTAWVCGTFVLLLSDGYTCDIPMYYFPSLADTIMSPQHFTSSAIHDR
jgi:hypothetical protein